MIQVKEQSKFKVGWNARLSDPTMTVQLSNAKISKLSCTTSFFSPPVSILPRPYFLDISISLEMNRGGRGAGRGRAGAAAGSSRAAAEGADASTSRTTPSGSATGTPSRTPSATPGRTIGASRASRAAPAVTGRFRPKAVRRNEAERDTIARQEEKKASDKLAEEKRARGRSRFRSSRSRGDAMGARGGRGRGGAVAAAAGPFSSGFAGSFTYVAMCSGCGGLTLCRLGRQNRRRRILWRRWRRLWWWLRWRRFVSSKGRGANTQHGGRWAP